MFVSFTDPASASSQSSDYIHMVEKQTNTCTHLNTKNKNQDQEDGWAGKGAES